ncbi:hypothetical protein [Halomarina oriensis]|uniref:Uncharacterized protein n=1 Tax=Halomarina oriensis TaxID=671145 RepID=A0A6B0GL41_9EURY|nr:hypothetical protein [Halomarina oriensis]MWG34447.1 hypothetical protein [Halomarina oriensis]
MKGRRMWVRLAALRSRVPRVTDDPPRPTDSVDWRAVTLGVLVALCLGVLAFSNVLGAGVASVALFAPGVVVGLFERGGRAVLDDSVLAGLASLVVLTVASVPFGSTALPWVFLDPGTVAGFAAAVLVGALAGVPLLALGSAVVGGTAAYARRQFLAGVRAARSA